MSSIASSTLALQAQPADRAAARAQAYAELQEMSKAMVEEKGLLNYAQAALLLDVSTKRISELVRPKKLKPFDFLGRRYVSMREVGQRYQQDLKTGRPRRGVGNVRWPQSGLLSKLTVHRPSLVVTQGRMLRRTFGQTKRRTEKSFGRFGKR